MKSLNYLFFFLCFITRSFAQDQVVSGTVRDSLSGASLPGVSVVVAGTTNGTATDQEGTFSLEVTDDPVSLEITFIGYETKTVSAGAGSKGLDILLAPAADDLQEVVVIGYGSQKKRDITGSVSTLNTENFTQRPISRLDQGLVGQIAGVRVKQTTGMPGKPFSINIRGMGSIGAGNEPLYVVDGFPLTTENRNTAGNFADGSPLDNLNPNDIESIQVLKDAAAAAIYGSRAANGVVIINTKKGSRAKPQITFNTYAGLSREGKRLDMQTAEQWVERAKVFIDDAWVNSGTPGAAAGQSTEERRQLLGLEPGEYDVNYMYDDRWDMPGHPGLDYIDWQDRAFRTGDFQNYQLSVSGGSEAVQYYVSGNYQNTNGYVIGTSYEAFSARANVDATITPKLRMGLNLAPTFSIRNDPGVEGKDQTLHKFLGITPVQESTPDEEGKLYTTAYAWGSSGTDPLPRLTERVSENRLSRTLATGYLSYDLLEGLTLRTSLNFDNYDNVAKGYLPSDVLGSIRGTHGTRRTQTLVNENTLTYSRTFRKDHHFSAVAGHSYNLYKIERSNLTSSGNYTDPNIHTLPDGATGSTLESRSVLISFFGRIQYDFKEKYLLTASLRADGSSRFGPNERWGTFPSVSGGWRLSDEPFMQGAGWLDDLKIRASYGVSGSNNIGDYDWTSNLSGYNYSLGDELATGLGISAIQNNDLHWETSYSQNYGLDFTVLGNRIYGSLDVYRKKNTDLLLNVPTHAASGFTTYLTNIGSMLNKGWELEIGSYNLTGNFSWNTSLNLSHNANEVLSLGSDQQRIEIDPNFGEVPYFIMEVGKPMSAIFVIEQNGVLTPQDMNNGYPTYGNNQKAGDPRYVDANGDGKIDAGDRVPVGNPFPEYVWGITNTFRWKGFDLDILVQGQNGGYLYSLLGRALNRTGMSRGENSLDVDPAVRGNWVTSFGYIANTDWLYRSDYISIRSITLGYDIARILNTLPVRAARIYVSGENWFYWDKYDGGFNPEATNANLSGDSNYPAPGDYGGAPIAKSLVLGVNITF